MADISFDLKLDGFKFRARRSAADEGPALSINSERVGVELQEIINLPGSQFTSRSDLRPMFQTSWASGSRWEKPLISQADPSSYFISRSIDVVTEPGNIFPVPTVAESDVSATIHKNAIAAQVSNNEVYYLSSTNGKIVKWNGTSYSTLTTTAGTTDEPIAMTYDKAIYGPVGGVVFILFRSGISSYKIGYIKTDDSAGALLYTATDVHIANGANIFMHQGRLIIYTGSIVHELEDPFGSPTLSVIYDDGAGNDYLSGMAAGSAGSRLTHREWGFKLAVATAEGIYFVKNVLTDGQPTPFVYRIDRDNTGINIGTPVATLPPGTICLDIAYHLGSILFATTSDVQRTMANDVSTYGFPRITFYHLTNRSLGSIGSPRGGRELDEAPFKFLRTINSQVYIGGKKRIWVYDSVRGGIHPLIRVDTQSETEGTALSLVDTQRAGNQVLHIVTMHSKRYEIPVDDSAAADTSRFVESNYFDFSLPGENKYVTEITLMTDGINANESWKVSLESDDGSFTLYKTFGASDDNTSTFKLSVPLQGFRFRYKLEHVTTVSQASPSRVKGVLLRAVQGEFKRTYRYRLDLTEVLNIENEIISPYAAYVKLNALMDKQVPVTLNNYMFGREERNQLDPDTEGDILVRVDGVRIDKFDADEFFAIVLLVKV